MNHGRADSPRTPTDWEGLRRRLAQLADHPERPAVSPETRERILRERARVAAQEIQADAGASVHVQVLEFVMAYERHAIETTWVKEVFALRELTSLPGTPSFVAGILNLRGRILSVVDLKVFFDLPLNGLPDLNRIIVVGNDGIEFGLLVDAVLGVRSLREADIQPPVPTMTGVREQYLRGLTSERLAVLDAGRILADPRIVVRDAGTD